MRNIIRPNEDLFDTFHRYTVLKERLRIFKLITGHLGIPLGGSLRAADTLLDAADEQLCLIGLLHSFLSPDEQEVLLGRDSPDGETLFQHWHDRTAEFRRIELGLTAQLQFNMLWGDKMLGLLSRVPRDGLFIIPSHHITNQVEKSTKPEKIYRINRGLTASQTMPPSELVKTSLRTGRIANSPVIYRVVVSGSKDARHKFITEVIETIFQLRNPPELRFLGMHASLGFGSFSLAHFIGVTGDKSGYDGVVVVMAGVNFRIFFDRAHPGVVWAKCVKGFEALRSKLRLNFAEDITINADGHVTVFPAHQVNASPTSIHVDFNELQHQYQKDPAVNLLAEIYEENRSVLALDYLPAFVDSLAKLELTFTRLDVMQIAGSCKLFPFGRSKYYGHGFKLMPSFLPEIGEFGLTSYLGGKLVGWKSLGISRHVQPTDSNNKPKSSGLLNWCESRTLDGEQWFTYSVQDPSPYDDREMLDTDFWVCGKHLRRPYQFRWEDILSEARQISQRLDIDIDKISFCYRINSATELTRLEDGDWNELPTKLYYHWSPHSSNPCKAEGFMSTEITPDFTQRDQYMTQCWDMRFRLSFDVYNMSDDWGRRYEQIMRSMPGTYPGVRMEEVS